MRRLWRAVVSLVVVTSLSLLSEEAVEAEAEHPCPASAEVDMALVLAG